MTTSPGQSSVINLPDSRLESLASKQTGMIAGLLHPHNGAHPNDCLAMSGNQDILSWPLSLNIYHGEGHLKGFITYSRFQHPTRLEGVYCSEHTPRTSSKQTGNSRFEGLDGGKLRGHGSTVSEISMVFWHWTQIHNLHRPERRFLILPLGSLPVSSWLLAGAKFWVAEEWSQNAPESRVWAYRLNL